MNGGSYSTSLVMPGVAAAASSASTAPDEWPSAYAVPPASSTSAWRSSTSRSTAYGGVSPLSPRPRRSYVETVKFEARRSAWVAAPRRSLSAPPTITSGGPSPDFSNAIVVPSFEVPCSSSLPSSVVDALAYHTISS